MGGGRRNSHLATAEWFVYTGLYSTSLKGKVGKRMKGETLPYGGSYDLMRLACGSDRFPGLSRVRLPPGALRGHLLSHS